jgi:tRNA U38,U39,U40 pseudouridine synthase TruA
MIIHNQVRRMVGAAVAAAVGRLDLEASGNITKIRVENPDPHGSRTGSVFALFELRIQILVLKLHSDFFKRLM